MRIFLWLALLACDWAAKWWAVHALAPVGALPVGEVGGIAFALRYAVNTGAAWGLFQGHSGLLFGVRLALIAVLIATMRRRWAMALVIAGAIGNAIDYLLYGHVVDFVHIAFWGHSFPIFNLADTYITLGAIALCLQRPKAVHAVE